jgi:hypothetical protein
MDAQTYNLIAWGLIGCGILLAYCVALWRLTDFLPYLNKLLPDGVGVRAIVAIMLTAALIAAVFVAMLRIGEGDMTMLLIGSLTTATGTVVAFLFRDRKKDNEQ